MRKTLMLLATTFMLASSLLFVASALAFDPDIVITPDTSVVLSSSDSVRIWILASDPDPDDTITVEKSYGPGTYIPKIDLAPIYDEFYFHPDTTGIYTFIFPVTDVLSATTSDTTSILVGPLVVDFRQSANDDSPYPPGDVHWISSILQEDNSKYYEGMSTLQRIVFTGIPKTASHVHTLNFSHQANKATSHAYDFLTSWPQGVQAGTEIGGPTMFVSLNQCGPEIGPPADLGAICAALHSSGYTATPDAPDAMGTLLGDDVASSVAAYETQLGNRTVKVYGNAPISSASLAFNGYTGSGDMTADYTLTWTSSSDSIVIELGGHLAAGVDPIGQTNVGYGVGKGSANISGGPYHFKLSTLDGASLGSQDNQIKGADIILPSPVCDVAPSVDSVCVGSDATFTDNTTSGTPPYTYCWEKAPYPGGCTSTTNQLSIIGATLADAGTYRVIVTDANNLKDTCYAILAVTSPPVLSCSGDELTCDSLLASATVVSDPSQGASYFWTPEPVSGQGTAHARYDTPGTKKVVVTIDATGCKDSCEAVITQDVTKPVLSCSGDDLACDSLLASATVVSDPSQGVSYFWTPEPVSGQGTAHARYDTPGTKKVVVTIDATGCKDSCEAVITQVDTEPPVALCPDDITQNVDLGECTATVAFSIDATDNCPGVTVTADPPSGSVFAIGLTTVEVVAVDGAGNADTCYFNVTVNNDPPVITCPDDDSAHAGQDFVSSDFSVSDPESHSTSVAFLSINPSAANVPTIVGSHVEWTTTCDDDDGYTICLETTDECGAKDTCCFTVTVYNQPPQLACPPDDSAKCLEPFVSVDISVYDADDPSGVVLTLHSISPTPENAPSLIGNHIEWTPTVADLHNGPDFTFTLVATDPCGAADTCQFVVTVYNLPPIITPPPDDSIHAGYHFVSEDFSVTDQKKGPVTVTICGINPASTHTPSIVESHVELQTECDEAGIVFTICLEATDDCGAKDTGYFDVTVYNVPPDLTCPADDTVHATDTFVSTPFSVVDPEGDPVEVFYLDINPAGSYTPGIVGDHVEWLTTCAEDGDYLIRLVAIDSCGLADTCGFTVHVYDNPPEITCPEDDSVHAGDTFVSTYFSVYDPDGDPPSVWFQGIDPGATNNPTIVDSHVVWVTTCAEDGDYVITLMATAGCYPKDTCQFTVTVYNRPPELVCPDDDTVQAGDNLVSTDFSVTDPDGDSTDVTILDMTPPATNMPIIVGDHVEWATTCAEVGVYTIWLEASDICGAKDTCGFEVFVVNESPQIDCPDSMVVHGGHFQSGDFSVNHSSGDSIVQVLAWVTPIGAGISGLTVHGGIGLTPTSGYVEFDADCGYPGIYDICLEATDACGLKDTCCFQVTIYNSPPEIVCPDGANVQASDLFVSTDFSASDPDGESVIVALCGVDPTPINPPAIVDNHIEWQTDCDEANYVFTFCMEATDSCGAKDTCHFNVTVFSTAPVLICPDDVTVYAGDSAITGDYSVSHPPFGSPVTVEILDITPPATNQPAIVDSHVVWATTCAELGDYVIRLIASDPCGTSDTCQFTVTVYNDPPVATCPEDDSVHAGQMFTSTPFSATDEKPDELVWEIGDVSGPSVPTNDPYIQGDHIEWLTTCAEDGDYVITLTVRDECSLEDDCQFVVTVYNRPPTLSCPDDGETPQNSTFFSTQYSVSDADGDATEVFVVGITPTATHNPVLVGNHVEWTTTSAENGTYTITLGAADHCDTVECSFQVTVSGPPDGRTKVGIPEIDCVNPGELVCLPIMIDNNSVPFGGFELHIDFDYTAMTFVDAIPGEAIQGFEYFTYRLLPCPACGCCKYKILLFGMYDLPNPTTGTPIPVTPAGVYKVLVELCFVVNSDENLRGFTIPVCWQWTPCDYEPDPPIDPDCGENTFSDVSGSVLYVSALDCQFDLDCCDDPGAVIADSLLFQVNDSGYADCENICGGIPVCDEGAVDCKRGDINLNTITYEVADAVLFAAYHVEGLDVFHEDPEDRAAQICASDVNADGRPLTLSDLVYLIRVILQDAVAIPKLTSPSSEVATMVVSDGTIAAECASPIGAILFEFNGKVAASLLASNMEMMANDNKVLVWSRNGNSIENAEVLSFSGAELTSVTAVDRDSRELGTAITVRMTPTAFALHAAYPNPFNPRTNLSFTLPQATSYTLSIYNVSGQLVRSYQGEGTAGRNVIAWDGQDNFGDEVASGVYFCKLTAGSHSATAKMVMMK